MKNLLKNITEYDVENLFWLLIHTLCIIGIVKNPHIDMKIFLGFIDSLICKQIFKRMPKPQKPEKL